MRAKGDKEAAVDPALAHIPRSTQIHADLRLIGREIAMAMPHDNQFEFDVFVSYSSKDKEWVRGELLKRIEAAGLKAFIDFRDFTRGAPSIKEMERGVVECRKTLLVLTPNYIESEWAEIENIMAQT